VGTKVQGTGIRFKKVILKQFFTVGSITRTTDFSAIDHRQEIMQPFADYAGEYVYARALVAASLLAVGPAPPTGFTVRRHDILDESFVEQ
jgi:hypothetical protein